MGIEIERKFLVINDNWKRYPGIETSIKQGYLSTDPDRTVRIRLETTAQENSAYITIKGKGQYTGITRLEYEYPIPYSQATDMFAEMCQHSIEKTRITQCYFVDCWQIDVFGGDNAGLVVAEIELASEYQLFDQPSWLGPEVTYDPRYLNSNLGQIPFKDWKHDQEI